MNREQRPLPFGGHGLYIELDPERVWTLAGGSEWIVPQTMRPGSGRLVHVISPHAFGEIRGYVLDECGTLHLRHTGGTGEWTELDDAVCAALGATMEPYALTAGGHILRKADAPTPAPPAPIQPPREDGAQVRLF